MTTMQTEPTLAEQAARLRTQLGERQSTLDGLEQQEAALQAEWTEALAAGGDTAPIAARRAEVEKLLADERAAVEQLGGWLDDVAAKQRKAAGFTTLLTDLEAYTRRVDALAERSDARQLVHDTIKDFAELARQLNSQLLELEAEHAELTQQRKSLGYRATQIGYAGELAPVPVVSPEWALSREMEAAQVWNRARVSVPAAAEVLGRVVGYMLEYPENLAAMLEHIAPKQVTTTGT